MIVLILIIYTLSNNHNIKSNPKLKHVTYCVHDGRIKATYDNYSM
jgi:hypothetical protein